MPGKDDSLLNLCVLYTYFGAKIPGSCHNLVFILAINVVIIFLQQLIWILPRIALEMSGPSSAPLHMHI